jgi:hypothetical protein
MDRNREWTGTEVLCYILFFDKKVNPPIASQVKQASRFGHIMPSRSWTIYLTFLCFALVSSAGAAVLNTSARVTVIPFVEIGALDPEFPAGAGSLERLATAELESQPGYGLQRLRITGPADLSMRVSLRSLEGELLEAFAAERIETHGPDGELILDIEALTTRSSPGQAPLLLYLEYE